MSKRVNKVNTPSTPICMSKLRVSKLILDVNHENVSFLFFLSTRVSSEVGRTRDKSFSFAFAIFARVRSNKMIVVFIYKNEIFILHDKYEVNNIKTRNNLIFEEAKFESKKNL